MEWIEANIYTTSEGVEVVYATLMELGITAIQIEDFEDMKNFLETNPMNWDYVDENLLENADKRVFVKFYLSKTPNSFEVLTALEKSLKNLKNTDVGLDLGTLLLEMKNVDDDDWKDNWKKHYKPIEIGKNVVIKPAWEEYKNDGSKIVFTIDPGHVFGTGLHQTTQLCIEQIEKYAENAKEVLDLGHGTGILSIISMMLGAKNATAIDIEHDAIAIAYENAEKNGIAKERYHVLCGNALADENIKNTLRTKKYNLVIANIVADVIIGFADFVCEVMEEDGVFICSGIIDTRVLDVSEALKGTGFEIVSQNSKDDWYCIVAKKRLPNE
ncbi:MAG: 50S ribosomal protein L11 methyltransferase [Defluviitaleaceae bacterium]|nr:50S ribosomal protein L11 methyltransferase [Defluviitaleaceae bacterium]